MSIKTKKDVGITGDRDNAYTVDAKVHNATKEFNTQELIDNMEPYQSRFFFNFILKKVLKLLFLVGV